MGTCGTGRMVIRLRALRYGETVLPAMSRGTGGVFIGALRLGGASLRAIR